MKKFSLILLTLASLKGEELIDFDPFIDIPFKPLKNSADRIREHGYPAESHFVETSDGYVLNVFRIPYSPKLNNKNKSNPVVLLQHGLFSCSDSFLLNGPNDSIAFNFADNGFDVWLGNARGNIYSRNNTRISLNHPNFWSFSWHEIGNVDIPEIIDYILNETSETKIHYIGHSQGCTTFFVMASTRPEYNKKIKTAHMLAPPIFMGNVTDNLVVGLASYLGVPGKVSNIVGNQQFIPYNRFIQRLLDTACGGNPTFPKYCSILFFLWAGSENRNINATLLPLLAETHPAGISTNQGIHYIQEYISNEFRQFDHGRKKNTFKYGQPEPPTYPIELITSNVYIYYGLADTSANYKDIQRLRNQLPNIKLFYEVPDPYWGHLDFIFALKVKKIINDPVIQICKYFEKSSNALKFQ